MDRSNRGIIVSIATLSALVVFLPWSGLGAGTDTNIVERGRFVLHKFEQAIGAETYTIGRIGDSLAVDVDFMFTDRGSRVPLVVSFRCDTNLVPVSFGIRGRVARSVKINDSVSIGPGKIIVRHGTVSTELPRPGQFFTIAGYAPITMQALMVRFWRRHDSPRELMVFPDQRMVRIEPRGRDTVTIRGKPEYLLRYTIEGLIWGREWLWFNDHEQLVAAVTTDAEFDHFEAVQEGFEEALGTFVSKAGADGMASLAEISGRVSGSRAPLIALVGGTLIDGTGKAPVEDAAVVIERGRILAAGPRTKVPVPRGAQVVDTRGKTVLPGLWDMHAHVEQVEWGPIYLAAGVTTVRDCGNEFEFITAVRDAIVHGRGLGPRILAAGIVDGTGPSTVGVERVDTPEQARAWTDRYHAAGFEQMKIYGSVKLEELKAVAEEAHRLGMTVTGHVPTGLTAYQAVEAGQDQINHIPYVIDMMTPPLPPGTDGATAMKARVEIDFGSSDAQKALSFLKVHGTVIDPTLTVYELSTATTAKPTSSFEPGALKVAPELAAQYLDAGPPNPKTDLMTRIFQKMVGAVGALHKAGVTIVAGTDQSVPGHSLHRELELYVQAGFTPMEAIQAATIVPARVMKLDKELGSIEAGKRADLVIVNGNPLESIGNIRKIESVVSNGVIYQTADLWQSVGFKP